MARRPRIQFPGGLYHVMARGNRKSIIYEDDHDRHRFMTVLTEAADRYELLIDAVCLMDNHYHVLCETPHGNLSDPLQFINGVYTQFSNRRHGRIGHLFSGRFRSVVVQREGHQRRAARYVVRNPVRAGKTADAESWPWSTYRATAGLEPAPHWLNLEWLPSAFRAPTLAEAQEKYRRYVNSRAADKRRFDISAIAIGSPRFIETLEWDAPGLNRFVPLVLRSSARPTLVELFADATIGRSRWEAMKSAHFEHRYTLTEIARQLGVDRSTVGKAIRRTNLA